MMPQTITIENIILAYREVNAHQPRTIFFLHGNSSSAKTWENQLDDAQFASYRLIAFDLPAHGDSGVSPNPQDHYGLADLGRVMGQAINKLTRDEEYLVIGCSLGSNILCEALSQLQPKGLVMAASSIVGEDYPFGAISNSQIDTSPIFMEEVPAAAVRAFYANSVAKNNDTVLAALFEDYNRVKSPFRSVMFGQSMHGGRVSDEIALLKKSGVPLLVVFGAEEKIIKPDYLDNAVLNTWRNTVFKIPAAGHLLHLDQPVAFNQLVADFAHEIL
ncbi:MAG: alpha/beta hydrolase fold protein [Adhaeribacter sp.]|nr:alpha/beta hydrolase fold protein [Adhaeribacter sp.]